MVGMLQVVQRHLIRTTGKAPPDRGRRPPLAGFNKKSMMQPYPTQPPSVTNMRLKELGG